MNMEKYYVTLTRMHDPYSSGDDMVDYVNIHDYTEAVERGWVNETGENRRWVVPVEDEHNAHTFGWEFDSMDKCFLFAEMLTKEVGMKVKGNVLVR